MIRVPGSCLSAGAGCERSSQGRPSFSFLTIHRMVKIASQPESDPLRRRRRRHEDKYLIKDKKKQPPVGGCFVLVSGSCLSSHACRLAKWLTPFGSQEKSMGVSLPCDFLLSLFRSPPAPMLFAFFLARKLRSQACLGMEGRWLTGGKGKENDQPFGWPFSFVPGSCLSAGAGYERSS